MFLHDPQHTGRSPYRGPQEGKVEWLFYAGHNVYSSPAIDVDGNIYFGSDNTCFFSVTPAGTERWRYLGGGFDSSPLIASDGTIFSYGEGTTPGFPSICSFDRTGHLNWEYVIGTYSALSAPTISKDGETVYLAAKSIYAIRKDGTLVWRIVPDSTEQGFHYSIAMSPDGATLYVPGYTALYAIDTSGALEWKFNADKPSNPSVDNDGNVYFGAGGSQIYSLSYSGALRWSRDDIFWGQEDPGPVIGRDGTIYITGFSLHAIDYAGKLKWKYNLIKGSQCVPAVDLDGTIYFGTQTTRINADSINFLAINPNGTLHFQLSMRSPDGTVPDIDSRPAISADGKIYVGSDRPQGFHLYKIK
jgi:sugar lactone lactonase YvrE